VSVIQQVDMNEGDQVQCRSGQVDTIDMRGEGMVNLRRINSCSGWLLRIGILPPTTLQGGSAVIVIPRNKGESVVIGDDIILTVIEIKGDKCG